jgi:hypothetical protein
VTDSKPSWVVFDAINRELRTDVPFFAKSVASMTSLVYLVKAGDAIDVGAKIAEATWDDGTTTALVAPAGCKGTVAHTYDLELDRLAHRPSQVLLYVR